MSNWINVKDKLPEDGQLVVKYWSKTDQVWAGVHRDNPKYLTFDLWYALPAVSKDT